MTQATLLCTYLARHRQDPLPEPRVGVYGVGVFVPRYALAGVIGLSLVLPLTVARIRSRRGAADLILCAALLATFCTSAYRNIFAAHLVYQDPVAIRPILLNELSKGATVAPSGTTEYLQLWYYAPPELRGRLVHLTDPLAALKETGSDAIERDYLAARRWSPVSVFDYDAFVAAHNRFLVYDFGRGWLMKRLQASGASIDKIGTELNASIYDVTMRP